MSEHIVPIKVYVSIFAALMLGTALTVWAGLQDFPWALNVIIALTIAVTKATLVVLYFMHVKHASKLTWMFASAAFIWLAILLALSFNDYFTRSQIQPLATPQYTRPVSQEHTGRGDADRPVAKEED